MGRDRKFFVNVIINFLSKSLVDTRVIWLALPSHHGRL
jgi:hypothetical protein